MKYFFKYNWQIRDEWFDLCKTIPMDKLYEKRIGGVQSIAHTLFHIVKVEYDWIRDLQQKPDFKGKFEDFENFADIVQLSGELRIGVEKFVQQWTHDIENKILDINFGDGNYVYCTYGEAIRHIIAHEIHHIGQLSVWAREIGVEPVSANFIHKGLFIDNRK